VIVAFEGSMIADTQPRWWRPSSESGRERHFRKQASSWHQQSVRREQLDIISERLGGNTRSPPGNIRESLLEYLNAASLRHTLRPLDK